MKKKILYVFLILLATGCNDPLDEFIYSSGAQLCGHYFILGDTLDIKDAGNTKFIQIEEDTFSVKCDQLGVYVLGSGTATKQLLAIDKLTVSVDSNQRIDSLAGRWRTLTSLGRNRLDSLQSSPDSEMNADSIRYYAQSLKMKNDYQQILFDIRSDFKEPHPEKPASWSTENASVLFYEYDEQVSEEETFYVVSTMVEEF